MKDDYKKQSIIKEKDSKIMQNNDLIDKQIATFCSNEIKRIEEISSNQSIFDCINSFINKFKICEIVCKAWLKKYYINTNKKNIKDIKLYMRDINKAFVMFGIEFEENLLHKIFSSNNNPGQRSAKIIRDNITHNMSEANISELINRNEEINFLLDSFLNFFR